MTASIIDTHSHIHGKEFENDLADILSRAQAVSVTKIALVGVNPDDTERALNLAAHHPDTLFVVSGLHPHESNKWNADTRQRITEQINAHTGIIRAVGEMGLDYHYDFSPPDAQRTAFIGQMEIARDADLPIVIHCREAYDDCMAMLRDFYNENDAESPTKPRGVLHCYFGTLEQAHDAIRLGFMIGIGGSSTFKKAEEVHRVIREIPLDWLVLETDAPYMAPVPHRGKRNEPAHLEHVVQRIAELKEITPHEVKCATSENARRLYQFETNL